MQYDSSSVSDVLAPAGVLARDFDSVWRQLWRQDHVPPRVLELCRIRLAVLHRAAWEAARLFGPEDDADRIAAVRDGSYVRDGRFDAPERAVLAFTEMYAQDPAAIDDELADAVKAHHGEPGLVCLVEALGFIDGRIRLALMFSAMESSSVTEEAR